MRALLRKLGAIAANELARAGAARLAEVVVDAAARRIEDALARRRERHGKATADRGN